MCVVRLCLQYQGRGGPLQIGTGGHIRGAVLGGSPLMADISVYARLRGMRPNLRPATYWKFWTLKRLSPLPTSTTSSRSLVVGSAAFP